MRSPPGSGSVRVENVATSSKVTAPTQMRERHREPADDREPRVLHEHPERRAGSRATGRRARRVRGRRGALPCAARRRRRRRARRRRASPRSSPLSRTSRSVSMSMWKRNSSSIRRSAARRANRRRSRARAPPSSQSHRDQVPQDGFESGGEAAPALELVHQRAAAGRGQPVVARPPIVIGGAPLAGDQPLLLSNT